MENSNTTIEKLIEKIEVYSKITFEILKFKAIYKTADLFSLLAIRLAFSVVVIFLFSMFNIGLSFWIGESLGKFYYGFFVVAAFYLFLIFIIYVFKYKSLRASVSNFIISESLKKYLNEDSQSN